MATVTTEGMIEVCATCGTAVNFHNPDCNILRPEKRQDDAKYYPRSTAVNVSVLPTCDICVYVEGNREKPERALYDGATAGGPWANMCAKHFRDHGQGLGLGRGQRLIVVPL